MSLRLENLTILRDGAPMVVLDRTVAPGEVLSVMGPSGCGKSTLLACLAGALPPVFQARGRVWLDGREITDLPSHARRLGMLFQDDILFPHLSVAGNLGFGLARGVGDRTGAIEDALREAGLEGMGARDPATLSGGQRARVALMRTLLSAPRGLLLDEAFSKLDTDLRAQMRGFVFGRARAHGLPVIMVTHDIEDARAAGGPVVDVMGRAL
ncbi:MAG: ATP-binding cassette domain-containing protein [Rhodobacteraceae bacterium]|nr:ATP-binding cassette domain-containing protein [Paracoccaceae bacterium]TVR49267.1 MAG: ATP-binding cassette domain-containing protein [Paracoccaceae bacterium]